MAFNFVELFATHRSIPISILLEPLLRKLRQESDEQSFELMFYDCKLIYAIIQHKKLNVVSGGPGLELTDFLAEAAL